jgi:hypothetical protein
MPPSIHTSMSLPTASAMAGNAAMDEGAPSSWRPPWLLTMSASAPLLTARRASSASMMPFRISLPPQRFLIHSTSPQLSCGSNCSAVHDASDDMSPTPLAWPTMLPKLRRLVPSMPRHQRGLVARLMRLASVGLGGRRQAVLDVLVALAQDLQIQRELQRRAVGGLGAVDQALDEVAVAHHVQLEPEAGAGVLGHVLDGADAHGRQRERNAKRLGRTRAQNFAIGVLHARQARGRNRHRHGHVLADHGGAGAAAFHVHGHALAQLDALEVARWSGRCPRCTSPNRHSHRTCAARGAWQ